MVTSGDISRHLATLSRHLSATSSQHSSASPSAHPPSASFSLPPPSLLFMLAPSSQLGVPCPKPSVLAPAARDPARLRAAGVSTSGGRLALRGSRLVGSHSINRSTRETVRGGRCMGIHMHTYPVPRLTGVQFWCPMQAHPPLRVASLSANRALTPELACLHPPPLRVACRHAKCQSVCHARSLMSICRAMFPHALCPQIALLPDRPSARSPRRRKRAQDMRHAHVLQP